MSLEIPAPYQKLDLPPDFSAKAELLCRELLRWGKVHNLTGHRNLQEAWNELILDALALAGEVRPFKVLDIGSGAGFPGLPLALARPELKITLLEPRAKRISFQRQAIRLLGLADRVVSVQARAGEGVLDGQRFETVLLRAVGSLPESLALAAPYKGPHGLIILPRSPKDAENAGLLGLKVVPYRAYPQGPDRVLIMA